MGDISTPRCSEMSARAAAEHAGRFAADKLVRPARLRPVQRSSDEDDVLELTAVNS
jgi:hypothetical protein